MLETEFTKDEILESLKLCNGDKAQCSDDFNIKFLQQLYHVIKDDVMELFRELHDFGKSVKSLNTTFFILIAKKEGVKDIKDFRPISLVDCIYKLITKVLAKKLSRVFGDVIGGMSTCFGGE